MKMLLGFFSLALSFSALAGTVDTKTFVYDGSANSVELLLKSEKTHTEYRTEQRSSTCYRREHAGYRTICTGGYGRPYPGPYPRPYPGRHPRPYPGRRSSCWQEPVYRNVPYSCVETVRTPFEVKDFDVDARVIVDVTKVSPEATPGEKFKVTLKGDTLSFEVEASRKFFVVKKKQDVRAVMNGSVKMIDAVLAAELIEAGPVLKAVKVSDLLVVNNNILTFKVGSADASNVGIDLKVMKLKTFGSDTLVMERELLASEVVINGDEASIDLSKLGVELENGKFSLTVKAFAKFNGNLMNGAQYSDLSDFRTLVYKAR